jgi:dihydrolipoamide dehydrogenase
VVGSTGIPLLRVRGTVADYDVVVLGSGPGGYVAAIRAAQLGMKTAVVERSEVGGICLNWGCIPSKALLRNAEVVDLIHRASDFGITVDNIQVDFGKAIDRSRKVVERLTTGIGYLLKKNGVELVAGDAALDGPGSVKVEETGRTLSASNVIIATGARFRPLAALPVDGKVVITSREALELREVPRRVVIVGGGATGVEFAYLYRAYGAEVTIVELLPHLVPLEDEEVSGYLERSFKKRGIESMTGSQVDGIQVDGDAAKVTVSNGSSQAVIDCDKVLVAVGMRGNIDGIGLESLGIATERDFVVVDDRMETNVPGVFAIGDVTGKLLLAHVASAQGVSAVEGIAGLEPPALDYELMPRATYCRPQIASFGLTEAQARERGIAVKSGRFPFTASGKALALDETEGMVKVVVDAEMSGVLGAHMIGAEVTELLGELSLARMLESTTKELGWLVHPHPTISEMVKEAALASEGEAIHV